MQKSEIRLIITSLPPEPVCHHGKTGGGVRLAEILRRLNKRDGVNILCITTPYNRKFFEKNGISAEFEIIKSDLKFKNFAELCLKSLIVLAKAFFSLKTDFLQDAGKKMVVYSASDLFWETIPAYYFKAKGESVRWIQVIHHIYPDWKIRPGSKVAGFFGYYLQRFSLWLIKKKADRIIVVNNIIRKELAQLGFSEDKIFVSSNGIDIDYFDKIEKRGIGYDGVFLGRLSPSKGIADLVEIWKNVCREIPKAKLAIIGGGEAEKKNLLKKIKENNLSRSIDMLGYLEDSETHAILKSGKVFLFPSHEEGWGIAIAEAMACSLPVVSWDLPSYKETFEYNMVQIKENDISEFSKNVIDLLKDDSKRKEIGNRGKEFIKKYSWDDVAKKELEILCA